MRSLPALLRIWSRIPSSCAIPPGAACRSSNRTIATIRSRRNCLLSFYEGKTIDFLVPTAAQPNQIVKGKVVRSGYIPSSYYAQNYQQPSFTQPIIEVDGVLRFGLPGQPLFPALSRRHCSQANAELAAAD